MSNRIAGRLALVIATWWWAAPIHGASPREDFESDRLLQSAVAEVSNLNGDQLEALINYLASCNPPPAPERDFSCERATQVVDIKTGQSRSLTRLRESVLIVDRTIPWKRSGTGDREAKDIERRVKLFSELSRAASERYERLNSHPRK
jgi:hypothetical protein